MIISYLRPVHGKERHTEETRQHTKKKGKYLIFHSRIDACWCTAQNINDSKLHGSIKNYHLGPFFSFMDSAIYMHNVYSLICDTFLRNNVHHRLHFLVQLFPSFLPLSFLPFLCLFRYEHVACRLVLLVIPTLACQSTFSVLIISLFIPPKTHIRITL